MMNDGVADGWSGAVCIDRALFPRVVARAFQLHRSTTQRAKSQSSWRESHKHDHITRLLHFPIHLTNIPFTAHSAFTTAEIVLQFSPTSIVAECEPSLSSPHCHCSSGLQQSCQTSSHYAHHHCWARGRQR